MEVGNHRKYLIRTFFKNYLELNRTEAEERETVESIRNGVEFKGANLWILIFAIFIASLGLNVNSTAVIIGAMLISPLMGPIMGVGLSVGLNDFELMKRSLKSFLVATLFSVMTATLYFLFTPLDEVQSELLARTSPTIYDVFIALVGGLAGIVALSTKEKGNVIPGVAIATALMPPLCTAGFGLATGNWLYFLGAFYLYFINSIHQSGYVYRSTCDEIPAEAVCGQSTREACKTVYCGHCRTHHVSGCVSDVWDCEGNLLSKCGE